MNTDELAAAALRDIADMVMATGITNVKINLSALLGQVRVGLEPAKMNLCDRADLDTIAAYFDAPLLGASHSTSTLWNVHTEWGAPSVRLPCGIPVYVYGRVNGRPLDLAPLPARRRGKATVR